MVIKFKKIIAKIKWKLFKINRPPHDITHNVPKEIKRNTSVKIKFNAKDLDHDKVVFNIKRSSFLLQFNKYEDIHCDEEIIMNAINVKKFINKNLYILVEAWDGKDGYIQKNISVVIK